MTRHALTTALLFGAATAALPELAISKHKSVGLNPARLRRRAGTVGTDVYDVLTWSSGGAYYANGEFVLF
jgi:hypothetical protein